MQILEPPSQVPNIVDGNDPPLLNQSNIYSFERLRTLWPGVSYMACIRIFTILPS